MIRLTLDCVVLTQSSVIRIIHCYVGLKCFFFIYLNVCHIISFFSYIYVSQGSVRMHLWCDEIHVNQVNANCPMSVPVKKSLKIGQNLAKICTKIICHVFYWLTVHIIYIASITHWLAQLSLLAVECYIGCLISRQLSFIVAEKGCTCVYVCTSWFCAAGWPTNLAGLLQTSHSCW